MNRTIVNTENVSSCSALLHDATCEKWTFEYGSKTLTMLIRCGRDISSPKNVVFEGVYAHNMKSCDYWGPSPHLFGIELILPESSDLYKQLTDEIKNMCYENLLEDKVRELFEARIQFTSGDVLAVLCQRVMIDE